MSYFAADAPAPDTQSQRSFVAPCQPGRRSSALLRATAAVLAALTAACTALDAPNGGTSPDLAEGAPPENLRICLLIDTPAVTEGHARALVDSVHGRFSNYGIEVSVPWVRPWKRPAFTSAGIMEALELTPLEAPCDRLMALVGRNPADFLVGLLGVEVLGAVDNTTHTRGFVVAHRSSLNQLLMPPGKTMPHEFHHLLGCRDSNEPVSCREKASALRRQATLDRATGSDFFPAISPDGVLIRSREAADRALRDAVQRRHADRNAHFGPP